MQAMIDGGQESGIENLRSLTDEADNATDVVSSESLAPGGENVGERGEKGEITSHSLEQTCGEVVALWARTGP